MRQYIYLSPNKSALDREIIELLRRGEQPGVSTSGVARALLIAGIAALRDPARAEGIMPMLSITADPASLEVVLAHFAGRQGPRAAKPGSMPEPFHGGTTGPGTTSCEADEPAADADNALDDLDAIDADGVVPSPSRQAALPAPQPPEDQPQRPARRDEDARARLRTLLSGAE